MHEEYYLNKRTTRVESSETGKAGLWDRGHGDVSGVLFPFVGTAHTARCSAVLWSFPFRALCIHLCIHPFWLFVGGLVGVTSNNYKHT